MHITHVQINVTGKGGVGERVGVDQLLTLEELGLSAGAFAAAPYPQEAINSINASTTMDAACKSQAINEVISKWQAANSGAGAGLQAVNQAVVNWLVANKGFKTTDDGKGNVLKVDGLQSSIPTGSSTIIVSLTSVWGR